MRPTKSCYSIAAAAAVLFSVTAALAAWPERPIRFVVPYAPGGAVDIVARTIGERMSQTLGQPIVVENRGGASGSIGVREVARTPADGYTLLLGTSATHGANPSTFKNLNYDAVKDFTPIALVSDSPYVVVVPTSLPVNSMQEFLAYAKANPGKINYGVPGMGGNTHLTVELFANRAGLQLQAVPYKGEQPAIVDLFSGRIQLMFGTIPTVAPFAAEGRLKVLAVTSRNRTAFFPEAPTLIESGIPDFESTGWIALYAPANTPPTIVRLLNEAVNKALESPATLNIFQKLGIQPQGGTPEALGSYTSSQIALWSSVVKAIKYEPN